MPEFDEFYVSHREALLLQTFALTGDLTASRLAVKDAFAGAFQHWRKVRHLDDPIEWLRPRAWSIAQRRSAGRIWHRVKGATEQQKSVLTALGDLTETQRKVLLLTQLTATAPSRIGREVGLPLARLATELERATDSLCRSLSCEPFELPSRLHALDPLLQPHGLPRASWVRRQGRIRQRQQLLGGAAAAVALTLVSGWFVSSGTAGSVGPADEFEEPRPVRDSMLLQSADLGPALPPARLWRQTPVTDNTAASGLNVVCQQERFADRRGLRTFVRTLSSPGAPQRRLVHSVEESVSPGAAIEAFRTASRWYSSCTQAGVQLSRAYRISGLGNEAAAFKLRVPAARDGSYLVVLTRAGATLSTLALQNNGRQSQQLMPLARLADTAMQRLCGTDALPRCRPEATRAAGLKIIPVLPPPSGEGRGALATTDLPPIAGIKRPWVGTPLAPAANNRGAATICDNANFGQRSRSAKTRTFLIPRADLPPRFGITEVYAEFLRPVGAQQAYSQVLSRMADCEDRLLGVKLSQTVAQPDGYRGSAFHLWRVSTEIDTERSVSYWMGVARVGRYIAQVNFTPAEGRDIGQDTFRDLLARARDRLFELPQGAPAPATKPSGSPTPSRSSD